MVSQQTDSPLNRKQLVFSPFSTNNLTERKIDNYRKQSDTLIQQSQLSETLNFTKQSFFHRIENDSSRLQVPTKKHQELPSILMKDLINKSQQSEYKFQPNNKGADEILRKSTRQFKNLIKPDVSYLQDSINFNELRQTLASPTILTTGDVKQDQILETTLSANNIGKTLIDLPSSLEDLEQLIHESSQQNEYNQKIQKERQLDDYLNWNFAQIPKLAKKNRMRSKEVSNRLILSRNSVEEDKNRKLKVFSTAELNKPKMIKPTLENLKLVSPQIIEDHGKQTLLNASKLKSQTPLTLQKQQHSAQTIEENSQVQINFHMNSLGQPSSRQDTLMLINWFQQTVQKIQNNSVLEPLKQIKLKSELSQKIQSYIDTQDQIASQNQSKLIDQKKQMEQLRIDAQEGQHLIFQRNGLIEKLKKKCINLTRDADLVTRKLKLIQKENYELLQKCHDQSEKLGEQFINPIDEGEKHRLMQIIEQEIIQENDNKRQKMSKLGVSSEIIELEQIPMSDVIQENDQETDMDDFVQYLQSINIFKFADSETQTEIKTYKDTGIGVKSHKIGNMKDRETMTDPRLIQSLLNDTKSNSPSVQVTPSGRQKAFQFVQQKLTSKLTSLVERFDESMTDSDVYGSENNQNSVSNLEEENDEDELYDQIKLEDSIEFYKPGFDDLKHSKSQNMAFDFRKRNTLFGKSTRRILNQKINSTTNLDNFEGFAGSSDKKQASKKKKTTIMEVYVNQARDRIKNFLQGENLEILKNDEQHKEFIKKLVDELKYTSKEIQNMGDEMEKKEKSLKFQEKINRRFEKELIEAHEKIDILEMDNYMLREQLSEMTKQLEDFKRTIEEITLSVENDTSPTGALFRAELKKKLLSLSDKIAQTYIKAVNILSDDEIGNLSKGMISSESFQNKNGQETENQNQIQNVIQDTEINQTMMNYDLEFLMNSSKEQDEESPDTNQSPNIKLKDPNKKKAITRFKLFKLGRRRISRVKKSGTHPAQIMAKRIISKDVKSLKDVMPQWVYDNFLNKYGLKNVAEKKFRQMISSCLSLKDQLPRIRLFGRFIELHNELQPTDYTKYLEMIEIYTQQILNFKIDDDTDVILLPFTRAIEYFKQKFDQKYLAKVLNHKLSQIEKMKVPVSNEDTKKQKHLKSIREAVDFDEYSEFVIDCYSQLQEDKENSIRDIYLAVDVNNDGYMSYLEFKMLMKTFHNKSSKEIWNLFEEYGKTNVDPQNPFIKYLNLENFMQLALDKEYFDQKSQKRFEQSKNLQSDFEWLKKELPNIVGILRSRLIQINLLDDFELLDLIEDFQTCLKYPFSHRVAWLCYRIVDEHFKSLYLKKMADNYLPIDLKQTGIKVKSIYSFT
eukprot:403366870